MSKAKQFIKDYTSGCSNELTDGVYHEWLTPEQALAAVEIAREEMTTKACGWLRENKDYVANEDNGISGWIPEYFIEDFKKAMEE